MPEMSPPEVAAFAGTMGAIADALALAMSEQLNAAVLLDPPVVTLQPVDSLMNGTNPVLQTTFSYPNICPDEGVLAFAGAEAGVLADLAGGGDGSGPPMTIMDEHMARLADVMNGIVQGLGAALGNRSNLAVFPGPSATAIEPLTLPPAFAVADQGVNVEIAYHIEGTLDGAIRMLVTPDWVRALSPVGIDEPLAGTDAPAEPRAQAAFEPYAAPGNGAPAMPRGIDLIMDIPLDVTVELGRVRMLIKDVLALSAGSIVELERVAGEPVDLLVNGRLVAKGEVVVIDDNFGIRITEIIGPADRMAALAKV
ncbi:MAG: flagellar motor switch protein FliN [Chthonomonadales bacterium]|nr:flagellar motor switch protein FliN [Chthonomonadales bacterium]